MQARSAPRRPSSSRLAGLLALLLVGSLLGAAACKPATPPADGTATGGQGGSTPGGSTGGTGGQPSLPVAEAPAGSGLYAAEAFRLAAEVARAVDSGAVVVEVEAGAVELVSGSGQRTSVAPHGWSGDWSFAFCRPETGQAYEYARFLVVVRDGVAAAGKVRTDTLAFIPNPIDTAAIDSKMIVFLADAAGGQSVRSEWGSRPGFCVSAEMTSEYGRPLWIVAYGGKNAAGESEWRRFVVDRQGARAWRMEDGLAERPGLTATGAYGAAKRVLDRWLGSGIKSYELVEYVGVIETAREAQLLRGEFDSWDLRFRVTLANDRVEYVTVETVGAAARTCIKSTGSASSAAIPPGEIIDSARAVVLMDQAGGKAWRQATPQSIYRISSGILGYNRQVDMRVANIANQAQFKRISIDPTTMKVL